MEKAFYFDNEGKRLFAILHSPNNSSERKGVIFCHPYGEEKQFSYRVFVRFARELCNKGFYVLRFDCFGYGDSQGDFEEATIETQIDDTIKAIELFETKYKVEKISLLGLRLGATISALVAEQDSRVEKLILWSPIINGEEYLGEILRKKVISELTNKNTKTSKNQIIEELKSKGMVDIDGHCLTQQVYDQLSEICLTAHVSNSKSSVAIYTIKDRPSLYRSCKGLLEVYNGEGRRCEIKVIDYKVFWDSLNFYDCYFPTHLYGETLRWMI